MGQLGYLKNINVCYECLNNLKLEHSHNIMMDLQFMENNMDNIKKLEL